MPQNPIYWPHNDSSQLGSTERGCYGKTIEDRCEDKEISVDFVQEINDICSHSSKKRGLLTQHPTASVMVDKYYPESNTLALHGISRNIHKNTHNVFSHSNNGKSGPSQHLQLMGPPLTAAAAKQAPSILHFSTSPILQSTLSSGQQYITSTNLYAPLLPSGDSTTSTSNFCNSLYHPNVIPSMSSENVHNRDQSHSLAEHLILQLCLASNNAHSSDSRHGYKQTGIYGNNKTASTPMPLINESAVSGAGPGSAVSSSYTALAGGIGPNIASSNIRGNNSAGQQSTNDSRDTTRKYIGNNSSSSSSSNGNGNSNNNNGEGNDGNNTGNSGGGSSSTHDTRCEQIIRNFYSKFAQIIVHLRAYPSASEHWRGSGTIDIGESNATLPPRLLVSEGQGTNSSILDMTSAGGSLADTGSSRRTNKWFNIELEDIRGIKAEVEPWRQAAAKATSSPSVHLAPPPMLVEVCLDVSGILDSSVLQVDDIFGRQWTVDLEHYAPSGNSFTSGGHEMEMSSSKRYNRATEIVLEVWQLDLNTASFPIPPPDLPRVYKQAIVLFRSLYCFANLLPSVAFIQKLRKTDSDLRVFCKLRSDSSRGNGVIGLDVGLTGTDRYLESHEFQPVATPTGTFVANVRYRRECKFSISPSNNTMQNAGFVGMTDIDDTYFTPTLSSKSGSRVSLHRHQVSPTSASRASFSRQPSLPPNVREIAHQRPQSAQHAQHSLKYLRKYPPSQEDHASFTHYSSGAEVGSIGSERLSSTPAVNPFRARPLSIVDGSAGPSYYGGTSAPKVPSKLSSNTPRIPNDASYPRDSLNNTTPKNNSPRHTATGLYSHSLGTMHGSGNVNDEHRACNHRTLSSRHNTNTGDTHSHSSEHNRSRYEQHIGSIGSHLSSSGGGADTGSMLHRSVMLRQLGGSLSPTDNAHLYLPSRGPAHPGQLNYSGSGSESASPQLDSYVSSNLLYPDNPSHSAPTFISPFKSPSLSSSPGGTAIPTTRYNVVHGSSFEQENHHYNHHIQYQHSPPMVESSRVPGLVQLIPGTAGSPSSFTSNTSSHNRRLSSSFGNRRFSLSRQRTNTLAAPYISADSGSTNTENSDPHMISRRRTVFEGEHLSGRQNISSSSASRETQDIDDFIRMVEAKKPLKIYSKGSEGNSSIRSHHRDPKLVSARTESRLGDIQPRNAIRGEVTRRNTISAPRECQNKGFTQIVPSALSIEGHHEHSQSSVEPPMSTESGSAQFVHRPNIPRLQTMDNKSRGHYRPSTEDGGGSPFRRRTMPNPFRVTDNASPSRNQSFAVHSDYPYLKNNGAVDSETPSSSGKDKSESQKVGLFLEDSDNDGRGPGIGSLEGAFEHMTLDSRGSGDEHQYHLNSANQNTSTNQFIDTVRTSAFEHTRTAAPGLDPTYERPLPKPVSIPRPNVSSVSKSKQRAFMQFQQNTRLGSVPFEDPLRGKSQPENNIPYYSPATPRASTPHYINTHQRQQQHTVTHCNDKLLPENIFPHSDFVSNTREFGSPAGMAGDDSFGMLQRPPRSTPQTPSPASHRYGHTQDLNTNVEPLSITRVGSDSGRGHYSGRNNRQPSAQYTQWPPFPPLSFIVPRNKADSTQIGDKHASDDGFSPNTHMALYSMYGGQVKDGGINHPEASATPSRNTDVALAVAHSDRLTNIIGPTTNTRVQGGADNDTSGRMSRSYKRSIGSDRNRTNHEHRPEYDSDDMSDNIDDLMFHMDTSMDD